MAKVNGPASQGDASVLKLTVVMAAQHFELYVKMTELYGV